MDSNSDLSIDLLRRSSWARGLARRLVGDDAAADDLLQDAWLRLSAGGRSRFSPAYLARVLRNAALERVRRDDARSRRERERTDDRALPSTDELLSDLERQRVLVEAVERLSEPHRRTILLVHYQGLSAAEIARLEGVPAATVRVRHKRALDRLREALDHRFDGDRAAWVGVLLPLALPRSRWAPLVPLLGATAVKKTLLAAAAVAAVSLTLVVALDTSPEEPRGARDARAEAAAGEPAAPEAPRVAAPDGGEPARAPGGRRSPAAASRSLTVAGRVLGPEGGAPSEPVEVFALTEAADAADLRVLLRSDPHGHVAARATAAADGGFELALPQALEDGPRDVHLLALGRRLYLPRTERVVVAAGETRAPRTVLSLACGTLLRGSVTGPGGGPVAGARLELAAAPVLGLPQEAHALRLDDEALAAADGGFEIPAVPSGERYTLFVEAPDLAPRRLHLEDLPACEALELDLALALGGELRGRVVDEDGAPVAGAEVRGLLAGEHFGFDDRRVRADVTGSDGGFALAHLPPGEGRVRVAASRAGFLESERLEVRLSDGGVQDGCVVVLPRGQVLAGRVVDAAGSGFADARVEVAFDPAFGIGPAAFGALRGARGEGRSDAEGRFAITGLGNGPFRVRARAARGETPLLGAADGVRGGTRGLELVLHPPLALEGRVRQRGGAPVPDARVRARRLSVGAVGDHVTDVAEARSDAAGAFRLEGLVPGRWSVGARADDAALAPSEEVAVSLPGAEPLELVLDLPAAVAGVVLAPDGRTVSGASVAAGPAGGPAWSAEPGARPEPRAEARTDARGRFRLTGLRPGPVELVASADGYAPGTPVPLALEPGGEHGDVELRLRSGATLTGLVHGDDGRPAAGHLVNLVRWQVGDFDARAETTDAEGRFAFEHVVPGTWQVVAMQPAADWSAGAEGESLNRMTEHMQAAQVSLEEGATEHVVLGQPAARPILVRGRVLRGGQPFPDVIVHLTRVAPSAAPPVLASVDDDATFSATVDGPGRYAVALSRVLGGTGLLTSVQLHRDVPDAAEHELTIPYPGGVLAGRVLGPDGAPAAGARVSVLPGDDASGVQIVARPFGQTAADAAGRFRVEGLVAGSYSVAAGGGRFARVVLGDVRLGPDEVREDVDLELPAPAEARIAVVDAAGAPAAGATVFARTAEGRVLDPISSAVTDATGSLVYGGLAPGEYAFSASRGVEASAESGLVRVGPGARPRVELSIEPASVLWVLPRDPEDRPVPVGLSVTDELGREVGARIPADDAARLQAEGAFGPERLRVGPLPPGLYRLEAVDAEGRRASRRVRLRAAGERTVTLRLDAD